MKSNKRITTSLAVVISLFGWVAPQPSHGQQGNKAANQEAREARKKDRAAKKEEKQEAREERQARKAEREAKKGERQEGQGGNQANKEAREAKKEARAAQKEEREAKRAAREAKKEEGGATAEERQAAGQKRRARARDSAQPAADGSPGTNNLGVGEDPFEVKGRTKPGGKRAANRRQANANATGEGEAASEATQGGTAGEQPAAKGRRAKAKAAATASNASAEATTTTSTPSTSTGATSSSVGGDTPAAVETPVEQPEATEPAAAGGGKDGTNQKFMKTARQDLNKALNALKRASADKGGHRERAVDLVQQAVAEVDKGMAFDKQNPNDRQRERPGKRSEQQPRGDDVDGASGVRFVAASWAAQKPSEQPNMQMAKTHLQSALSNLDRATADKGGFRVNAVRLAREALKEVEQGIAYDNTHKDGN